MTQYPNTVHYLGLNTPRRIEGSAHDLTVIGTIPPEVEGAFFRAVPDPAFPPMLADDNILSADGAINKIEFRNGRVRYDLKYVRTARFLAEQKAGRSLFGRYRNPFTDDPSVAGIGREVANTTPIWHAGRLLMTKEDGRPYEIDPKNLDTVGLYTYDGALRSLTHTAHPVIDPRTREMFFFGYEADELCSRTVAYGIVNPDGTLRSEQWFSVPYCSFMHDFAVTAEHALFPVFPTTSDIERLKAGKPHWRHEQDWDSWIGIMPRYGSVDEMVWFKGPAGVHAYHVMNAFTAGRQVHLDMCIANTNMLPFVLEDSGLEIAVEGGLVRWTMDLDDVEKGVVVREIGPLGELPVIADADRGLPYERGWYLSLDPTLSKPLHNGPVGMAFNLIIRANPATGEISQYHIGDKLAVNEPVHIPAAESDHGGWLMAAMDREIAEDRYEQEVWIWAADDLEAGPVARVLMPFVTREQVHGNWVPRAELDRARPVPATAL
jgi:carotenoid cleavage dioxygenase